MKCNGGDLEQENRAQKTITTNSKTRKPEAKKKSENQDAENQRTRNHNLQNRKPETTNRISKPPLD